MSRLLHAVATMALAQAMAAQSCLLVVRSDAQPAQGTLVTCPDGTLLGAVDAFGQFCGSTACDTLVIGGHGLVPLRVAWSEALAAGHVTVMATARPLPTVDVLPWPTKRDRQALAAASSPDSSALRGFEGSGLRNALMWVPGVQMDERGHGGSTRLSIRGSLLRAPYGVRGVKVYWGPFALTLADGSTPLELLDPELVGTVDVVRSVGGPAYGSAPAGLLLADPPWRRTPGITGELKATAGPYGYFKLAGSAALRQANGTALTVGVLRLGNDGYRQQEYARRDQVFLAARWRTGRSLTRVLLTGQRAAWGLPGSIDSATAARDPRLARPYSLAIDAHIEKSQVLAGLSNETALGHGLHLRSAVQAQAIDKVNPYGTTPALSGYKDERIRAAGARLAVGGEVERRRLAFAWEAGLEVLLEQDALNERAYAYAVLGDVRTDARTQVGNGNGFLTTRTRIGERTTVFADVGLERTGFRLQDALRNITLTNDRPPVPYPLLGVEQDLRHGLTAHVRYAESRSRPTIWEALGSTGVFNSALAPEQVREGEAGLTLERSGLTITLNGYVRRTDGLILQRTVDNGTAEEFYNAGDAAQNGVEASARIGRALPGAHRLELLLNGAWQHHRLHLPELEGTVDVPGVPRWTTGAVARLRTRWGPWLEAGCRTVSALSASVSTTDRLPAYAVLHVRLEQVFRVRQETVGVFVHGEDLTDTRYTSFVQLNDPGRRYANPAPGRSVFVGAWLRFARESAGERSSGHD
ncbi:MAG: TonB-dependent receptor [Bacteroidetes bacterium]|nr:TonB-dependent receptor [Bacteroidota bacterium]